MTEPIEELRAWCKTKSCELPIEEICESIEAYDEARAALQQAQADAAAMREALKRTDCFCNRLINHMCPRCLALTTDSGKAILAALKKCEKALEYCGCHEHNESPCDESVDKSICTFCNTIDEALAAIRVVKGERL